MPGMNGLGVRNAAGVVQRILGQTANGRSHRLSPLAVHARFVRLLLWEFRWPLGVFAGLVVGGGLIIHHFYGHEQVGFGKAFYAVFLMVFLESGLEFPDEWYLQPLFFLVPIVGLGALADSVVRLAYLMFTKKQRLPEWHRMMASLYRNHVVVVGAGKVGFLVIKGLLELNEQVVAIEVSAEAPLLDELYDLGVPVIQGNGRLEKTLAQAGVGHARAVILSTNDDLTNIDAGLAARDLNPGARVVLRLFDESLAAKISGAFAMPAISTAQVSAPAFIAAATGRKVYQEFQLAGRMVHLTDLVIAPEGGLVGRTVGEVQAETQVNVVMHQGAEGVNINPSHSVVLGSGDSVLVIAPVDRLLELEARNRPGGRPPAAAAQVPARAPQP
jgi:Trk K+ transport system NAD-binding subunit